MENIEQLYSEYKPLLFSLAYRMLGSLMDAEDIIQEVFLTINKGIPKDIQNIKAYLCKSVTNRCIDRLRSAANQREVYTGPWLPEPHVIGDMAKDPLEIYLQKESITTAYLLLLQQMSWVERTVFLLREVLQFNYEEIAEIVGKSSINCRQIFHRAKQGLDKNALEIMKEKTQDVQNQTKNVIERFVNLLTSGDTEGIKNLLVSEATLISDGGGKVKAALRPIYGSNRVCTFLEGILKKVPEGFSFKIREVNGVPGIVSYVNGQPLNVISFHLVENKIVAIYLVANPDKLGHVH
ncbi:RNA polymerase sigma-70 factor [Paenibacillus sp. BSR1-1]|uniref:RNA polymerase sigma-70 factor n=1 Tax=Paenibacillus sp. BSR1-1 TaxID=3020845 RepID=UPI0025B1DFA6|nr:RNA polymerase sigma-70 factor [Paenibacillus sp. BSR1-1]MDN3017210.1 RNA polymerase sigma-70 factor [Paenibacillus sp. BSR1-1]